MDKIKQQQIVTPSDFYWGVAMILSVSFLNIFYSSGKLIGYWYFSLIFLILGMIIIGFNKIKNKFDYKEVNNDRTKS